jgi:non-canonical (house-cleaning) NTP pyrophosphatase
MSEPCTGQQRFDQARVRALAALAADRADYSFTYECGLRVRDRRYEAHTCPDCAGPVRPDEEPT